MRTLRNRVRSADMDSTPTGKDRPTVSENESERQRIHLRLALIRVETCALVKETALLLTRLQVLQSE